MMSTQKKCLTVFGQRMAAELMKRGHKLVDMKPDNLYPDKNVFFFSNTEAVHNDIKDIKKSYIK